jgi:hypothetical protein
MEQAMSVGPSRCADWQRSRLGRVGSSRLPFASFYFLQLPFVSFLFPFISVYFHFISANPAVSKSYEAKSGKPRRGARRVLANRPGDRRAGPPSEAPTISGRGTRPGPRGVTDSS